MRGASKSANDQNKGRQTIAWQRSQIWRDDADEIMPTEGKLFDGSGKKIWRRRGDPGWNAKSPRSAESRCWLAGGVVPKLANEEWPAQMLPCPDTRHTHNPENWRRCPSVSNNNLSREHSKKGTRSG